MGSIENNSIVNRWMSQVLATIGATLTGALLLWIAGNQMTISTSQAVLQRDFQAQAQAFEKYNAEDQANDAELRDWMSQIWPRLRNHGENMEILKRHLEGLCSCEVQLNEPERF